MVCEHLQQLEQELLQSGVKETFRGQAWSHNCRERVYFQCVLGLNALRKRMRFGTCVQDHQYHGTHGGSEAGFVCAQGKDAIMGAHSSTRSKLPVFQITGINKNIAEITPV